MPPTLFVAILRETWAPRAWWSVLDLWPMWLMGGVLVVVTGWFATMFLNDEQMANPKWGRK